MRFEQEEKLRKLAKNATDIGFSIISTSQKRFSILRWETNGFPMGQTMPVETAEFIKAAYDAFKE